MPTTQIECLGQFQGCAYRIFELNESCDIEDPSAARAYVGTAMARASMAVELKEGAEVEATTACGAVAYSVKDIDRIKGWNIELELVMWDYEILQAAIGGTLITGGTGITPSSWRGKTIGWAAPGADITEQHSVSIEIWSRTATDVGACSAAGVDTPRFIRHIYPRATLQLQDRVFEDGQPAYMRFNGFVQANPKIFGHLSSLTAAHDDEGWIGTTTTTELASSTYAQMFSNTLPSLPDDACALVEYDLT